jgi:hypothetical protein
MRGLDVAKRVAGRVAVQIETRPCAYVYPGNHRRCRRPVSWHERGPRGFNITADNHDYVEPGPN